MLKENFGEIIYQLRINAGLSQQELAQLLCKKGTYVSNQHIYKWEKNVNRPNALQFISLCTVLGLHDVISVFTTEISDFSKLNIEGQNKVKEYIQLLNLSGQFKNKNNASILDFRKLPVYTQPVSAGTGMFLDSDDFEEISVDSQVPVQADFGIRITGDSMTPSYVHHQIVWVHKQSTINHGEVGIFLLNGNAYIKQFYISDKNIQLYSFNPAYSPIPIHETDEFLVYGKVLI